MRLLLIDFLRGYSIFTIVVMHLFGYFPLPGVAGNALSFGGAGVHVFILVSGFGLCLSQLNKPLSYWQFLRKRFLKVYLPYIFVILLSATIPFTYAGSDRMNAVCSHLFLYKMFDENLMSSFGAQFWFISMIFSFYAVFPALFRIVRKHEYKIVGGGISLIISLLWASLAGAAGKSDLRIWNSFFLQYLWEFMLGMILALKYNENQDFIKIPPKKYLLLFAAVGAALTGYAGIKGGVLKMYNDIPSMAGYLSLALLTYSFGIKCINRFFIYTGRFSYEWYLVHILIFVCTFHFAGRNYPAAAVALTLSYGAAMLYNRLLKRLSIYR